MTGEPSETRSDRPPLPRDSFRGQRTVSSAPISPVVVTPDYGDEQTRADGVATRASSPADVVGTRGATAARSQKAKPVGPRNPFDGYGERSSSRPYALRLPDAIDLVLRQMAAEERTHPLRIVDRILYDHLRKTGRLPPVDT